MSGTIKIIGISAQKDFLAAHHNTPEFLREWELVELGPESVLNNQDLSEPTHDIPRRYYDHATALLNSDSGRPLYDRIIELARLLRDGRNLALLSYREAELCHGRAVEYLITTAMSKLAANVTAPAVQPQQAPVVPEVQAALAEPDRLPSEVAVTNPVEETDQREQGHAEPQVALDTPIVAETDDPENEPSNEDMDLENPTEGQEATEAVEPVEQAPMDEGDLDAEQPASLEDEPLEEASQFFGALLQLLPQGQSATLFVQRVNESELNVIFTPVVQDNTGAANPGFSFTGTPAELDHPTEGMIAAFHLYRQERRSVLQTVKATFQSKKAGSAKAGSKTTHKVKVEKSAEPAKAEPAAIQPAPAPSQGGLFTH